MLSLRDQDEILKVIRYLVEIHQKPVTVADVMRRFGLTADQYRMCSNLAVPALAKENMDGRFTAVKNVNKRMRREIKALYEAVKDEDGLAADGVRKLYRDYCDHGQNVVYGSENEEG